MMWSRKTWQGCAAAVVVATLLLESVAAQQTAESETRAKPRKPRSGQSSSGPAVQGPSGQEGPSGQNSSGRRLSARSRRPDKPAEPRAPFRLTPQEVDECDAVLSAWEQRSSKIKTLTCDFTLFVYDPVFPNPDDPAAPSHLSKGRIWYMAPDKGKYKIVDEEEGDYWACDGENIYEMNYVKDQVIVHPLPEELRGKAIANGPLPFMFGAKADDIKARYWVRLLPTPEAEGQVWLEAVPKFRQDAANFLRVQIILSEEDMLPIGINQFEPNHTPKNDSRKVYAFENMRVNKHLLGKLTGEFDPPRTPRGWKRVIEDSNPPQQPADPEEGTQARRPSSHSR